MTGCMLPAASNDTTERCEGAVIGIEPPLTIWAASLGPLASTTGTAAAPLGAMVKNAWPSVFTVTVSVSIGLVTVPPVGLTLSVGIVVSPVCGPAALTEN